MNCSEWEERIALLVEVDLPAVDAAQTRRHLEECAACREFAAGVEGDLATLRAAHHEPIAPAAYAAVRNAVLERIERKHSRLRRLAWIGTLAAAAIVLLLVANSRPVEPPHVAVAVPPAPLLPAPQGPASQPKPPVRVARVRHRPAVRVAAAPIMVKLVTDDPNVVIYWIAN